MKTRVKLNLNFTRPHAITYTNRLSLQLISKEIRWAEREYMNMHPQINALVTALGTPAVLKDFAAHDGRLIIRQLQLFPVKGFLLTAY